MREESMDKPSTKRTLKRYASKVFQESSVGIVSSVAQATSTKRKVFKILVFIVCLSGFLYQSGTYLSVVLQYPTAVDIDVLRPDTYNVPAYTFCDNNRNNYRPLQPHNLLQNKNTCDISLLNISVNRRLFCEKYPSLCEEPSKDVCNKYPTYCGQNGTLKPKKEHYYMYNSLRTEDVLDLNDLDAVSLTGNDTITGPLYRIKDWEQIYLCYSLNDRVNNSLLPLTSSNSKIMKYPVNILNFKVKADELFLPGNRAGLLFAVHSPFEAVNPFETGVFLRPGRTYVIYVSTDEEILEKSPYDTDCVNHTELWEKNGRSGPRSQNMCTHNCAAEVSLLCFGCIIPVFLYPKKEKYCELEAEVFENMNCPNDTSEIEDLCMKTCRDDCRQTKFRFTVQERFKGYYDHEGNMKKDVEDIISVEIYLDGDEVIVYKHSPKYMNVEVFSSIGGFIGIWLGMSLLDITDIVEGLFRISRFSFKRKQELKENRSI